MTMFGGAVSVRSFLCCTGAVLSRLDVLLGPCERGHGEYYGGHFLQSFGCGDYRPVPLVYVLQLLTCGEYQHIHSKHATLLNNYKLVNNFNYYVMFCFGFSVLF